ncbi:hypothetical protein ANACAC_00639 [Anaerostipes caccae L1-92]|uniref:Uncharacterized protein n=1 Tax=Anaerostipes caccae (strain DSM 14662 / CCUG 47493 / JCM 13470 / NCIMB 13811 / L1-92) TaxID=411490 RepID=B0MAR3_ANACD|nr:hypothetical protein ANACAC_00639 [Anaerostipes caccae L1-92]
MCVPIIPYRGGKCHIKTTPQQKLRGRLFNEKRGLIYMKN